MRFLIGAFIVTARLQEQAGPFDSLLQLCDENVRVDFQYLLEIKVKAKSEEHTTGTMWLLLLGLFIVADSYSFQDPLKNPVRLPQMDPTQRAFETSLLCQLR